MSLGCDSCTVTYLIHDAFLWFVKDSMAMRSYNIRLYIEFLHELIYSFTEKFAVSTVKSNEFKRTHLLGTGAELLF